MSLRTIGEPWSAVSLAKEFVPLLTALLQSTGLATSSCEGPTLSRRPRPSLGTAHTSSILVGCVFSLLEPRVQLNAAFRIVPALTAPPCRSSRSCGSRGVQGSRTRWCVDEIPGPSTWDDPFAAVKGTAYSRASGDLVKASLRQLCTFHHRSTKQPSTARLARREGGRGLLGRVSARVHRALCG